MKAGRVDLCGNERACWEHGIGGVGVSAAADFAGDGTARASKHSNTIEILMAFDDMLLLISVTSIQTPGLCRSRLDEGYLLSPLCETKNEQKLQTFL